jgi:hypothetical protein
MLGMHMSVTEVSVPQFVVVSVRVFNFADGRFDNVQRLIGAADKHEYRKEQNYFFHFNSPSYLAFLR